MAVLASVTQVMAAPQPASGDAPRMAMGVIVKLRDDDAKARKTLASVVRLQVSDRPSGGRQHMRARIAALQWRRQVPYMHHKPTAFAAELIHAGHPVPLAEAEAMARRLRADPDVAWAVPNEMLRPATVVGQPVNVDPSEYDDQPWLKSRADAPDRPGYANFPAAWGQLKDRTLHPVVVAVLDSGILPLPDLDGRMWPGYDFVSEADYSRDGGGLDADPRDEGDWLSEDDKARHPLKYPDPCKAQDDSLWHGLFVTNMLAATPGNSGDGGVGILSPLPNQVVLPVRVSGVCGASTSDIIEGMLWAAGIDYQGSPARNLNPARVINISLGGEGDCASNSLYSADWLYRQTVLRLKNKGVLVVASAGNGGEDGRGLANLTRPASCDGVLAVTSVSAFGFKAVYANLANSRKYGEETFERLKLYALAAAGGDGTFFNGEWVPNDDGIASAVDLGTTVPIGSYAMRAKGGTSFAAPMVSGVAALMLAVNPSITVQQLLDVLSHSSEDGGVLAIFSSPSGSGLPACDPEQATGNCLCSTGTCGGGMLDAEAAIAWAIDQPSGPSSFVAANEYASEFVPDRLKTSSRSGGGGGALDAPALIMLFGALALVCVLQGRRAHQSS